MTTETVGLSNKTRNLRGPQLDDGWQQVFLAAMREYGARWKAARVAGVHVETVRRYADQFPAFAADIEDARQEYADELEAELREFGKKSNNPLGHFGLLKRHRPELWNDKILSISLNASVELAPDVGADLLRRILAGGVTDATLAALAPHEGTTTHALGETQSERIIEGECQPLAPPAANAREAGPTLDTPPGPPSSPSAAS